MSVIQVSYYTDPACPWSWAQEPALRKLVCTFGESLRFSHVMCGMAREFGDPQKLVAEALAAGASTAVPVDPRLWFEGAPCSSFPACIAVKAAAEQGDPAPYLRRLRVSCPARTLQRTPGAWRRRRLTPERLGSGELWTLA